jgi:hypothetical protein
MDADFEFDFEKTLEAQQPSTAEGASGNVNIGPGGRAEAKPRNYRQVGLMQQFLSFEFSKFNPVVLNNYRPSVLLTTYLPLSLLLFFSF